MAQTLRGVPDGVRAEGENHRYAAIAALGLARCTDEEQRAVLAGRTAGDLAAATVAAVSGSTDPGAVALAAWAAAEVNGTCAADLFDRLDVVLSSRAPLPTVDAAWIVTASIAAAEHGDTETVMKQAVDLLTEHRGEHSTFPHVLPASGSPRWRSHVGSFADQVYPVQALARAAAATGRPDLLDMADRTAANLCRQQGPAGQWWWHYDTRTGDVVERYPVYSVHQHAMAPMVLMDLYDAGGADHRDAVARGVSWIFDRPEVDDELLDADRGVIWRKVGRRERWKAARAANSVVSAADSRRRAPGLDRLLPPTRIDHECRPYELGWLLYAWLPPRGDRV